jgi:putative aldouronate transport system substrate-binding protein
MMPTEQPSEFKQSLPEPVKKVFESYKVDTYVQLLGSVNKAGCWFPMYSYSNNMKTDTAGGTAWNLMGECKHKWLPQVVMSKNFDKTWDEYMAAYKKCKPEDFLAEMQKELDKRIADYEKATKK